MPPADDDIEARLAIVERDVAQLREQLAVTRSDAAAARLLAAGADHDVSEVRAELRAHTQALNALREVQLKQGREMREGFAEQGRKIDEQGRQMREGFTTLATGMAQITALLTNLGGSKSPDRRGRQQPEACGVAWSRGCSPPLQPRTSGRVEQCSPPGKRVISE
ncbi:MAG: hypothetical protein M3460_01965 [Actinomycetota bacterium]|nr:hypothetical protein [Actinomycetota bacterium]